MVIKRNDGETDDEFIARLGESVATALPAEGFVCSILSNVMPPADELTELSVLARAKVGRPVASVLAFEDRDPQWFVIWKVDGTAPDRGNFTKQNAIICSLTARGAFDDHVRLTAYRAEHGWSPNYS